MDRDPTTERIISHLLSCQAIKCDQNVKHKLHEFVTKFGMNLIEESMKYAGHAGKDFIDGDDVRLAIKHSKENTSKLDIKDLEEAEKLKVKYQIKEIKETPSIHLGAQELENMKPVKHLVTHTDLNQNKLGQKQSSDTLGVPKKMNSMTENRDFQSPGLIKKVKVDNAYLE